MQGVFVHTDLPKHALSNLHVFVNFRKDVYKMLINIKTYLHMFKSFIFSFTEPAFQTPRTLMLMGCARTKYIQLKLAKNTIAHLQRNFQRHKTSYFKFPNSHKLSNYCLLVIDKVLIPWPSKAHP